MSCLRDYPKYNADVTDFVNKIRQKVNDVLRLFRTRVKLISVLVWHIFIRQNAGRFQKNAIRGTPSDLPARGGGGGGVDSYQKKLCKEK